MCMTSYCDVPTCILYEHIFDGSQQCLMEEIDRSGVLILTFFQEKRTRQEDICCISELISAFTQVILVRFHNKRLLSKTQANFPVYFRRISICVFKRELKNRPL